MYKREQRPGERLRRWSEGGAWLIIVIFLVGGALLSGCGTSASTTTPTPPSSLSQPTSATGPFHTIVQTFDGDFTIALDITPNRSGSNRFHAQVTDNHTRKPALHILLTLYTTMQDMPMGTDSVVLQAGDGGQFSAMSTVLNMGGHWAIGLTIQTTDHVIHKAGVSFVVPR